MLSRQLGIPHRQDESPCRLSALIPRGATGASSAPPRQLLDPAARRMAGHPLILPPSAFCLTAPWQADQNLSRVLSDAPGLKVAQ
jgi:hypothetical protein